MLYDLDDELVGSWRKMRGGVLIQDLEYADKVALVSDSMDALKEVLRALDAGSDLSVSVKKTKTLAILPWPRRKKVKTSTKMCLLKAVVPSTLLYGSETWVPSATLLKCLQAFIMQCLCVVLGVSRWDQRNCN